MATLKLAPCLYAQPPLNADPGARIDFRTYEVTAADLALTDQFIGIGVLPAGHRLMDFILECDDLDTGTDLTFDVGILNTYYNEAAAGTTGFRIKAGVAQAAADYDSGGQTDTGTTPDIVSGHEIFTGEDIGQSGGRSDRIATAICEAIGVDHNVDRIIAIQFPVAAGTPAAGTINFIYTIDKVS